ncbi:MAG: hypothetical protein II937_06150 [Bacteroidales bacterium]|nr:hypothetical protein [Bacteroidales bacterium]
MTQKDLQIIKNADFSGDTHKDKICNKMRSVVKDRTDDYSHPENISSDKIDMTETVKRYGWDVDLYKAKFGSTLRSEQQAVDHLVDIAKGKGGTPSTPDTPKGGDADKEKRRRKLKIKLKLQLQLAEN